jgi:succinate dehydrogenase / fumarate reductase membrane anchor subunit
MTFLFILSLGYHAWVGVRDIWMDYIKATGLRVVLHVLTLLALLGYAGWAIQIIWRL